LYCTCNHRRPNCKHALFLPPPSPYDFHKSPESRIEIFASQQPQIRSNQLRPEGELECAVRDQRIRKPRLKNRSTRESKYQTETTQVLSDRKGKYLCQELCVKFDFAVPLTPAKLDKSFTSDQFPHHTLKLEIIAFVTESEMNLMCELVDNSPHPRIVN
jgi:hypothetical protein